VAAAARIQLSKAPPQKVLDSIRSDSSDVIAVTLLKL
jgi:hypothetical protein